MAARPTNHPFAPLNDSITPEYVRSMGSTSLVHWHVPEQDRIPPINPLISSLTQLPNRAYISTDRQLHRMLASHSTLAPHTLIFHVGRCGSSFLARALELSPTNRVFLEPRALNHAYFEHALFTEQKTEFLADLVSAFGLGATPLQQRLVIKLSSLWLEYVPNLRRLFPSTRLVLVYRNPGEIAVSIIDGLSKFLQPQAYEKLARKWNTTADKLESLSHEQLIIEHLSRLFHQAATHRSLFDAVIGYPSLVSHTAHWLEQLNDAPLSPKLRVELTQLCSKDSKDPHRYFHTDTSAKQARVSRSLSLRIKQKIQDSFEILDQ